MLTEQPDIDTAPAMLALAARPVGILTVVPGPIASATALLRNTLAPAVRVMCGAHESEMDDADGAAIAANLNIRSLEIHAESVSAVVAALGNPAHDFSDGVVIVNAQPARVSSTRPLVAPLNGLRVGTKLCVDVDVFQWRTSSFQALMHALARSPTVHHFGWTAVCFAKDMFNGEYKLRLPDHVTSARFRTGAKYMNSVFDDDSSFPGLVDLHVETTPSDALANFHGQNSAIKRILLAAPRLQRLVIDVNGTKAFLLRTVDTLVKCAPACLAHVSVDFDMVDRTADLRWKNEARDLISKGEGEGARAGVRWAIRVFENYAASDELTMIT